MIKVNSLTIAIIGVFFIVIVLGACEPFSRQRIRRSLWSIFDNIEILLALVLSIYLCKRIFMDQGSGVFKLIYDWIPTGIREFLYGRDIIVYLIIVPLLLLLFRSIIRLFTNPLYIALINSISNRVYSLLESMGSVFRRVLGAIAKLPRALIITFVMGLLLNFSAYYFPSPLLSKWMNDSIMYQSVYKYAVYPVLNSNIAKKIPVIVNDSFAKTTQREIPEPVKGNHSSDVGKGNLKIISYFNGVTLNEAVKSNPQIDVKAKEIVENEIDNQKKAYRLYQWVSQNIDYDYDKAARIGYNSQGISSGSIIAFNSRKGICFDYSCLYISMCKAVGLKVRLVTGLGYSGIAWGDHAWNEVYIPEDKRWINIDTTFGANGTYFDKADFYVDHRYAEVQGEW